MGMRVLLKRSTITICESEILLDKTFDIRKYLSVMDVSQQLNIENFKGFSYLNFFVGFSLCR